MCHDGHSSSLIRLYGVARNAKGGGVVVIRLCVVVRVADASGDLSDGVASVTV